MLQFLRIQNLALMERTELEFGGGFTAVTGETGAGKSVLLGALALLSGCRADKSLVRQGAEACEVEAVLQFEGAALKRAADTLEKLGLPSCEDGALILRRTLPREKAPRANVNGALVTLGALQELGAAWVDFHGPGEPQKLFHENYQREMLDAFGGLDGAVEKFGGGYDAWRGTLRESDELVRAGRLGPDEIEFLKREIAKIDQLELSAESVASLERDFARMSRAQEIGALAQQLETSLSGEEGPGAGLPLLVRSARELAELDPGAAPLAQRLEAAVGELNELAGEFGRIGAGLDFDDKTVRDAEQRMNLWLELKRRYGPDVETVVAKRDELKRKVASQSDIEGTLTRLKEQAARQEKQLRSEAASLTKARAKAAAELEKRAAKLLKALGFRQAALSLAVEVGGDLREHGADKVTMLFAPNPGQEALPLDKIASAGETARVMLALKAVLADADATPLLVFDEVDANVGGETAMAVGRELARLGARHQVLCVTHLPQVAARAKHHFVVEKQQGTKTTSVTIGSVDEKDDARVAELARMLGDRSAKSAREHAKALLDDKG